MACQSLEAGGVRPAVGKGVHNAKPSPQDCGLAGHDGGAHRNRGAVEGNGRYRRSATPTGREGGRSASAVPSRTAAASLRGADEVDVCCRPTSMTVRRCRDFLRSKPPTFPNSQPASSVLASATENGESSAEATIAKEV
ncbi:hypothetical protein DB31_1872 [Hyalangium minutum]|uniref:Uncharacterized protein n=1 Tax=Hyalangium minutum TaxID=394096 RepID=A0A085WAZ1_9BACT|nr:hypothetical protein DB31_1872 [Hyalangium minutum]